MLSTCQVSVVFQIDGCLAVVDVAAMACMHVDTGRWVGTDRKDRLSQVCHSNQDVEDEQHFLFHCPAYSDIRRQYAAMFQQAFTAPDLITQSEPNALSGFLRECFSCRKALSSF
ncbi:hypothetical protein ABBQ38_011250 [Trebouxia sp. C0009 RCD-2024]